MRSCGLAFIGSSETFFFILSLLRLPLIHMLINKLRFIAVDRATFNRFPSIPRTNLILRFCWSSQRIILDEIIREKRCFYDFHGKISNVVMINSTHAIANAYNWKNPNQILNNQQERRETKLRHYRRILKKIIIIRNFPVSFLCVWLTHLLKGIKSKLT